MWVLWALYIMRGGGAPWGVHVIELRFGMIPFKETQRRENKRMRVNG